MVSDMSKEPETLISQEVVNERVEKRKHKQVWLIPMVASVVMIMTLIQLAFAVNRVQNDPNRAWEQEHDGSLNSDSLSALSRELQELTLALNYEMLLEMNETLNPFVDIARIPQHLQGYWLELYDSNDGWRQEYIGDVDEAAIQVYAHRQITERVSFARGRLSTLSSAYQVSYVAVHHFGGEITSGHQGLHALIDGRIDDRLIDELSDQFAHVIVIRYNAHGRWEVPFLLASETEAAIRGYIDRNGGAINGVGLRGSIPGSTSLTYQLDIVNNSFLEWQNPRRMTFVYGIPHDTLDHFVSNPDPWVAGDLGNANRNVGLWDVWSYVSSARTVAYWTMLVLAFLIPLSKVKGFDKGYESIRKSPVELVVIGTFIAWTFVHSNLFTVTTRIVYFQGILNWHSLLSYQNMYLVYFFGVLLIALCLLGYLVYYVKDLYASRWKTLRNDSLIYHLYTEFLTVDLKRSQNLRIFILVFGQILVGIGLAVLSTGLYPNDPFAFFVTVLIPGYLLVVFLYVRYKVAKIRKDYMRLFEITKSLANGNLEVNAPDNLGYFDSLKDELVTIKSGLGHAVERALTSERMKGDLITNVSHDLKTPLTSIITYVDLLKVEGLSDEKRAQYLETLELKTDRLKTLIEDLFEVSKASSGNLKIDKHEVDLVTLMKQTVLSLEDRLDGAGLTLREDYPEESVKMELDGGRMHRVFENLIINMVKYSMPHTRAYIDIISTDDKVMIILRNISNHEIHADMNDLSERFVRGEESRTTDGSGLGLAIAKSFVELQGGSFEIVVDGDLFKAIITFTKFE